VTPRPRVLVIAEAANPEWPSVPLVGWSLARALADVANVHLVTQIRNRVAIERTGWCEGREFTAIDSERIAAPLHKLRQKLGGRDGKGWTIGTAINALSYPYFERLVWKRFETSLKAGEFDLVHRITPLSPTVPSPIAKKLAKIGVPFVLGPLNGGLPWPKEFDGARRDEREWLSYVRSVHKLLPGFHASRRHASLILIASKATWQQMPARYHDKCIYLPENGIDPSRFNLTRTRGATRPIRCIFVGRLVPYKGPDMLLEAAAPLLQRGDITLDYIGDGPLMNELRHRAETDTIPGITFHGWIEHTAVQEHLVNADLLTLPSIREFGGAVVLEAMALGVPALIVDYGGPSELVTPETGFTVSLGTRDSIVTALRIRLQLLIDQPREIDRRSRAAQVRIAQEFTWSMKANQVLGIYRQFLDELNGGVPSRPRYCMSTSRPADTESGESCVSTATIRT